MTSEPSFPGRCVSCCYDSNSAAARVAKVPGLSGSTFLSH